MIAQNGKTERANNIYCQEGANCWLCQAGGRSADGLERNIRKKGVQQSTFSNIIRTACQQASDNQQPDLSVDKNVTQLLNSVKGCTAVLSAAQKEHLVPVTLQDAEHGRLTFTQLANAAIYLFILILFVCLFICLFIYFSVGLFFIK